MNHDADADPGGAPDAGGPSGPPRGRAKPLPAPRSPIVPPALGAPSPEVTASAERLPGPEVSLSPGHVHVTIELTDAAPECIELEASGRRLLVRAERDRGSLYRLVVELPVRVRPGPFRSTFRNGTLDVTLDRSEGDRDGE